ALCAQLRHFLFDVDLGVRGHMPELLDLGLKFGDRLLKIQEADCYLAGDSYGSGRLEGYGLKARQRKASPPRAWMGLNGQGRLDWSWTPDCSRVAPNWPPADPPVARAVGRSVGPASHRP